MTDLSDDQKVVTIAFSAPEVSAAVVDPSSTTALAEPAPVADVAEPVPADDAQTPVDHSAIELRLGSFIGFNADHYLDYYQEVYRGKQGGPLGHWHWVPFLFSIPWLFIRRRYFTGIAMALVPLALYALFPTGQTIAATLGAIALICGFAGRPLYLALALRKIEQVEARRLWPVQRDEQLHRAGGVSLVGALLGTIIWAGIAAVPFIAELPF